MKKILWVSLLTLFLVAFLYMFAYNLKDESLTSGFKANNAPELSISDLQGLLQTKSVPIDDNEDPGNNPPIDFFGILGNLEYPLKELEISDIDEIVITIRPSVNFKSDKLDAYIACNTEIIKQVKDEFCYFSTPSGTTPHFSISIYRNGFAVKNNIGIFGAHLSKLSNEFKPIKQINAEYFSTLDDIVQIQMNIISPYQTLQ